MSPVEVQVFVQILIEELTKNLSFRIGDSHWIYS